MADASRTLPTEHSAQCLLVSLTCGDPLRAGPGHGLPTASALAPQPIQFSCAQRSVVALRRACLHAGVCAQRLVLVASAALLPQILTSLRAGLLARCSHVQYEALCCSSRITRAVVPCSSA